MPPSSSASSQCNHPAPALRPQQPSLIKPPHTKFTTFGYGDNNVHGRPRMYDADQGTELNQHADLWFEDGSVICRAEDTLFRVHMSQLSRHSVFFRDMFATQPDFVSETIHSTQSPNAGEVWCYTLRVPVVYLHDVAEDVGNLLTALYDGPNFGNNDQDDFRVVAGVLRLSTKYIIESLRSKALSHLSIAWPSSLKAWDLREDQARIYENEASSSVHRYPHPLAVISLAREVDAPSLLPAAFYDLSRYSFSQIFEPHEDEPLYRPLHLLPSMSPHDIQCLCLGKESAHQTITSLIQAMGNGLHIRQMQQHPTHVHKRKTSSGLVCISAAACRKDFCELVDLATQHYLFDRERGYCDPLYVAEELGQLKSAEFSECKACAKSLEAWAAREREKIWRSISTWFRLETDADISLT